MNQGSVCSSHWFPHRHSGAASRPGCSCAPDCEHVDMEQAHFQCFPSYQHHSFWQEPTIQPATMTKLTRMQFCQATKNTIFGFRLQKMLNPYLAASPSLLLGRKCLSSAHIHEGRFDERWPYTIKCLFTLKGQNDIDLLSHTMSLCSPCATNTLSQAITVSLTSCLTANTRP